MNFRPTLIGSILALSTIPALADNSFEGEGKTVSLDCEGGAARVEGANNMVTVTGQCARLDVEGMANTVTVDLASRGTIAVEGTDNMVIWTTPDDSEPTVHSEGYANEVARAH